MFYNALSINIEYREPAPVLISKTRTMRELKFRAWIPMGHWLLESKRLSGKAALDGYMLHNWQDCIYIDPLGFVPEEETGIVIMQYTGLKDRNGVGIYEGDVISVHQFLFDGNEIEKEWIGIVEYITDFNCAGFGVKVLSGEFALLHTGYDSYEEMPPFTLSSIYGLHEESFHILGNIHEHPHLIEKQLSKEQ